MRTVLRIDGLRVVIYPNDHPPAHVHILGPGWVVVIDLIELKVRESIGVMSSGGVENELYSRVF